MAVCEVELVIVVQVVRRTDDRDDATKIVFAKPNDLLLATNPTVVDAVATGALTNSELVFNNPCEIARGDPERPLSS